MHPKRRPLSAIGRGALPPRRIEGRRGFIQKRRIHQGKRKNLHPTEQSFFPLYAEGRGGRGRGNRGTQPLPQGGGRSNQFSGREGIVLRRGGIHQLLKKSLSFSRDRSRTKEDLGLKKNHSAEESSSSGVSNYALHPKINEEKKVTFRRTPPPPPPPKEPLEEGHYKKKKGGKS